MEKKHKLILIAIIGIGSFSFLVLVSLGVIDLFGDQFYQFNPNSDVTGRADLLEEVHNITLEVEYITKPTEIWQNFSLYDFKTTVIDALEEKCSITANSFGFGVFITGINGVTGDWLYFVNDQLAGVAASSFKLSDGDSIHWKHVNV